MTLTHPCATTTHAFALMQALNAGILAGRSATLVLEKWCGGQHVTAERLDGGGAVLDPDWERQLDLQAQEQIRYRRVQLRCGGRILSRAHNWYVPGRLTPEMNRVLETTDTPFGKAVLPLKPYRRTLAVKLLWSPSSAEGTGGAIPESLFVHRAVLYTGDHRPFSMVEETYTRQVLAFMPQP